MTLTVLTLKGDGASRPGPRAAAPWGGVHHIEERLQAEQGLWDREARLAEQQAALRRVAARGRRGPSADVFAAVAQKRRGLPVWSGNS